MDTQRYYTSYLITTTTAEMKYFLFRVHLAMIHHTGHQTPCARPFYKFFGSSYLLTESTKSGLPMPASCAYI